MPNVDPYRTFTNDIMETYSIYGIEVARRAIIRETYDVLSNAGAHIDIRHIELLADAMTCRGFLQKIDRYGARKGESGPWALASFEETTSVLCEAASFGQEDNMNGVSSNVMFGQFVKVGTGSFDVYIDEAIILAKGVPPPKQEVDRKAEEYNIESTQGCAKDDFQFDFVL
jgi:DNA-directed RNA polymerase II subunit RPB1